MIQHIWIQIAALDFYRRYEIEKNKLEELFVKPCSLVCIISDLWVSHPQVMWYIYLTSHYIDDNCRLNNKILSFCEMKSLHTGD